MRFADILTKSFAAMPEWHFKNDIRYFLALNPLVPNFISDMAPVKGYELNYQLKPGDVVVDAGAFTGDYTFFASRKVGPTGRVLAFEPDPKTRAILARNSKKEKYGDNITIVPKGLWNENTTLRFNDLNSLQSKLEPNAPSGPNTVTVDVCRLDDELKKLGVKKVDVLKMDIEGAEIEAIQGCEETLANNRVNVIIAAYHIVNGETTSHYLEKFLRARGYEAKSDFPKHLTTYGWKK
jgi:FkbM family methyltransferase